ncbi:unnamed protein product [Porites evermanni]|uniref:Uncharacterized protein n=1 Tax=Porites evermanni TaxID=104178 RepID=A0ABN8MXX6_9CNID|nr:unnamed protein product [Porites evermanni]
MLIGRNVPTAFQPLNVIYGEADERWAEKYKFGWTIISPVCLDKVKSQECSSVSVNRVTVQRKELPDSCILNVPQPLTPSISEILLPFSSISCGPRMSPAPK